MYKKTYSVSQTHLATLTIKKTPKTNITSYIQHDKDKFSTTKNVVFNHLLHEHPSL